MPPGTPVIGCTEPVTNNTWEIVFALHECSLLALSFNRWRYWLIASESEAAWSVSERLGATGRRAAVPSYIYERFVVSSPPALRASLMQKYQRNSEPNSRCHGCADTTGALIPASSASSDSWPNFSIRNDRLRTFFIAMYGQRFFLYS